MATVARRSARTRAADLQARLADAIVNGVYLPGAKLDEQELADAFGVSRTPVREALKHLAVTGLVALRPHRGAIVATITPANLGHLFETMAELEALCAGFAAARMRTAARRELRVMHEGAAGLVAAGRRSAGASTPSSPACRSACRSVLAFRISRPASGRRPRSSSSSIAAS
jgi:DNA-binding GntR family transcriptional regulator